MLRDDVSTELKQAMRSKNTVKMATLRLILAAIKDRDIAARTDGVLEGIGEDEVLKVLQTMVKQRRESIKMYEQGNRPELAAQEAQEIAIIQSFLPEQMDDREIESAVKAVIDEIEANSLKDMGTSMGLLRERYSGRMDFGKASAFLKSALTG
ncbi:MAG: GatB/YqeY domain-containing protein [Pseudomonadota bacterium]|nr:GatB/YqeY domain-containing protein [Pseudomonadota bacterium]